jgi:hypothetical protein
MRGASVTMRFAKQESAIAKFSSRMKRIVSRPRFIQTTTVTWQKAQDPNPLFRDLQKGSSWRNAHGQEIILQDLASNYMFSLVSKWGQTSSSGLLTATSARQYQFFISVHQFLSTYAISATTNAHQQCFSPFDFSVPYQLDSHATQCKVMQTHFMMHPFAHPSVNVFERPHND